MVAAGVFAGDFLLHRKRERFLLFFERKRLVIEPVEFLEIAGQPERRNHLVIRPVGDVVDECADRSAAMRWFSLKMMRSVQCCFSGKFKAMIGLAIKKKRHPDLPENYWNTQLRPGFSGVQKKHGKGILMRQ